MIPGPEVVKNELIESQRTSAAAINSNINTGITGVPTIVDKSPEVFIYEKSDNEA